jgi:hypothetical protein
MLEASTVSRFAARSLNSRLGLRLFSVPELWGALAAPRLRRTLASRLGHCSSRFSSASRCSKTLGSVGSTEASTASRFDVTVANTWGDKHAGIRMSSIVMYVFTALTEVAACHYHRSTVSS